MEYTIILSQLCGFDFLACSNSELIPKIMNLSNIVRTACMGNQPITRPLSTQNHTNTEEMQTFVAQVVLKPTIPVFEDITHLTSSSHCDQLM
jgi:hypothetical protein